MHVFTVLMCFQIDCLQLGVLVMTDLNADLTNHQTS